MHEDMGFLDFMNDSLEDEADAESLEGKSIYLTDAKKGLQLIASLLPHGKDGGRRLQQARRLDDMIDNQLRLALRGLEGINILEESRGLQKLSDQIMEYQKLRLLADKTIVAVGGQFSAGKSCFINSLLQDAKSTLFLPEDQNATTSIPTYIVAGKRKIEAQLGNGKSVSLDEAAVGALTHEFYQKYHIGFSRFVQNLVVQTPDFPAMLSERIALLDTPGYNKADVDTKEKLADNSIAEKQLKAADYLLWLINIDNGTIPESDIDFLHRLKLQTPVLFVFTRADTKPEEACADIVREAEEILAHSDIPYAGIAAYDSRTGCEYFGRSCIRAFLQEAAAYSERRLDVGRKVQEIIERVESVFEGNIKNCTEEMSVLQQTIFQAEEIRSIRSLVDFYGETVRQRERLNAKRRSFRNLSGKIADGLRELVH